MSQDRGDQSQGPGAAYKGYTVYDQHYEKVGKVDDLFVDENDQPEYIGVKMGGLLGSKSTLIPVELVRVNDRRQLVEIAADEETIKHAPTFENDSDITPEYEHGVYGYFGLEAPGSGQQRSGYGGYYDSPAEDPSRDEELRRTVDTEFGERAGSPQRPAQSTPPTTPPTTDGDNLDVPLGDPGSTTEQPREATGETPFDADAATRTGGDTREDVEVEGDRDVRVFKRSRR